MSQPVEIRVRYAETDQMGRAHHSHYVNWCELGRTTLMREHGISYAELERDGVLLPVARVEIEYRAGVGFDEVVRIHTVLEKARSRGLRFTYRIESAEGQLLARAATDLVSTNREGETVRLPDAIHSRLRTLLSA